MTITRAFTFVFEDPDWVNKLVVLILIVAVSGVFSPFLIGLLGLAIVLGYQGQLIRNVRASATPLLPRWDDFGRLLSDGLPVLVALIVYTLPNLLIGGVTWFTTSAAGNTSIVSGGVSLAIACCLFPLILVYNLVTLPMFTIAQGRYAENHQVNSFFEIGSLWDVLRTQFDAVAQWWIGMVIVGLAFSAASLIPCLGWLVAMGLLPTTTGALAGMLHAATYDKPKKKNG
ncbi:MAG: DUF4013 domain-containing protein [Anaerolineae bacterium]